MKKQSVNILSGGGGSLLSGCEAPAPVRASETGRARNWTMPPLRLERECKERPNSATIDNRCVEFDRRENQRCAFTMAEILLSLTIIGVVAAITLPSLTGNINERTWNTQRKALYARFSQAIALMPALNGYGTLSEDESGSIEDTAAETFVTDGLAKVLKINNICDSEHLEDCGISENITNNAGNKLTFPKDWETLNSQMPNAAFVESGSLLLSASFVNAKSAAFETANGESIAVFYNPNCQVDMAENTFYLLQPKVCANFVYDLNGSKGPNTVGKDLGVMTVLYPTDSVVVAPVIYTRDASESNAYVTWYEASASCKALDGEYRLPNREEVFSLFVNKYLLGLPAMGSGNTNTWTATAVPNASVPSAYHCHIESGTVHNIPKSNASARARCVKR